MYTKRIYSGFDLASWTRFETLAFLGIGTLWAAAYDFLDLAWLRIPWTPLALVGTAVAFLIGFQNNSAYGRIWEARMIWGGIVNTSRTLGMFVQDMVSNEHASTPASSATLNDEIRALIHRHIAWMTALRHNMRERKKWETAFTEKTNAHEGLRPPESRADLAEDLKPYLSEDDLAYVLDKDNKQTALLYLQSHHLRRLKERGLIWEFSFLKLEGVLQELFTLQGKSERIKNFPYPRQFATLTHYFIRLFVGLLPVALVPQFADIGNDIAALHPTLGSVFLWVSVPFYGIVAWVFHTMERIGKNGENPFEGTPNDVPISTIARGIEIDIRQNLGESKADIPAQFAEVWDVQF